MQTTRALDGRTVENTKVVGLVKDIGSSEGAAWREVGRLGLDKNIDRVNGCRSTFRELAEPFRQHELKKESGKSVMPNFKDKLSDAQINDLVAYLASLKGANEDR